MLEESSVFNYFSTTIMPFICYQAMRASFENFNMHGSSNVCLSVF